MKRFLRSSPPLPLIQEGQMSVSGDSGTMYWLTAEKGYACPGTMRLGQLTAVI